jgi:hypothetical protein
MLHKYGPDYREKLRAAWADPEKRAKRIASLTEAQNRPDVKDKISQTTKERWENPAYRQNHIDKRTGVELRKRTPEEIEEQRRIARELWATEEHQKKMSEAHLNSDIAREQSRINIQKTHTPEAIAKMAETKRTQFAQASEAMLEAHRQKSKDAARARWGDPSQRVPLNQIELVHHQGRIHDSRLLVDHVENIKNTFKPTLTELCDFLGVSRATLNNWMVGKSANPDKIKVIQSLSHAADGWSS